MLQLENSSGDNDCNFSEMKHLHFQNENHSINQIQSMRHGNYVASNFCAPTNVDNYDYIPSTSFHHRRGGITSTLEAGNCQNFSEEQTDFMSCSSKKSDVSVYENIVQSRNEHCLESREMTSDPANLAKTDDAKSKMIGMYIVEKTIGKGNFSVVKLATHKLTQVKVAIKIIDKTRLSSENLQKIHREVGIMKLLHHPHIVKLYQVMESDTMIYIVMEYVPNGEIFDYIANRGKFKEEDARQIFYQIVCAIEYCHARHIVHRDLKAENLLLDDQMNIKLADFGFGNFWQEGLSLSTFCGSPPYAAPEIFKGERYSGPKADIWSLGVVLYVLVSGSLPFEERTLALLKERVVQAKYRIPYWMSDNCEDLIKNMLCRFPERRISIRQILDHRWMRCGVDLVQCGPTPCLADDMRKGIFNEQIISIMQQKKMQRQHIIESLSTCAYDHRTALYLLLGEKMRRRARGSMPEDNLAPPVSASLMQRRPSSVAESLMANRGERDLQAFLSQNQQRQQTPPFPHQQQLRHLLSSGYAGNVIDAMQTDIPSTVTAPPPPPAPTVPPAPPAPPVPPVPPASAAAVPKAAWHHLPTQLKGMAISQLHQASERRHAMSICLDVTQPPLSPPSPVMYAHHHHQLDNGACCLSTSPSAPATHRHMPAPHRHRHHRHAHRLPPGHQLPMGHHHLHPAWLPRSSMRPPMPTSHHNPPPPVPTSLSPVGHHFNEGRRASDVGVTPIAMETQFAPLRAAARAGGVLDLVPTSEEEEEEEVSGLETVEFVQASQLPSPGLDNASGKRLSLPVACVHAPMDEGEKVWPQRRQGCHQLPTIISGFDEETSLPHH